MGGTEVLLEIGRPTISYFVEAKFSKAKSNYSVQVDSA